MLLSLLGVIGGYGLGRFSAAMLVASYPTLIIHFSYPWTLAASALGMLGGILGSFYPAILAARQDPVSALRDE
jgi:putative ABC transport system permease protein